MIVVAEIYFGKAGRAGRAALRLHKSAAKQGLSFINNPVLAKNFDCFDPVISGGFRSRVQP